MSLTLKFPNLLKLSYPLRYAKNKFLSVGQESRAWINRYAENNRATFDSNEIHIMSAYMYPFVDAQKFRLACDLNNWFFFYDDVAETSKDAEKIARQILGAINSDDEINTVYANCTRDILRRTEKISTPKNFSRFKSSLSEYVSKVPIESGWRQENSIKSVKDYMDLRLILIGYKPSFIFSSILEEIELKNEIFHSDIHESFIQVAAEIGYLLNDIFSCPKDFLEDSNLNIIFALMHEKNLSFQEAIDETAKMITDRVKTFISYKKDLNKTFSYTQSDIEKYLDLIEFMMNGVSMWYYESNRYKGEKVSEKFIEKLKIEKNLNDVKIIFE